MNSRLISRFIPAFIALAFFLGHQSVEARACKIKGFEFAKAWVAAGLQGAVVIATGDGYCSQSLPTVLIAGATQGNGLTCQVTLFSGGKFANGWKVAGIDVTGPNLLVLNEPSWPSTLAKVTVQARVDAGVSETLNVEQVRLINESDTCQGWDSALKKDDQP